MRLKALFMILLSFVLCQRAATAKPAADAATPPQLFTLGEEPGDKSVQSLASRAAVPDGAEEYRIGVEPASVAANPAVFLVDLPGQAPLEAVRTRFVTYSATWKSWSGTLRPAGSPGHGTGYINLGWYGDRMTGLIDFAGERFRIVGLADGYRLVRLSDDLSPLSCGLHDPGADIGSFVVPDVSGTAAPTEGIPRSITAAVATNRIDVLAVYPREFFYRGATEESDLVTFIQQSISLANDAFANSGVDAAYNLVGIVPLLQAQPPASGQFDDVTWMTGGGATPVPAEVAALRTAFGADVVMLYTPFDWRDAQQDICGVGNLPLANDANGPQFICGRNILHEAMGNRAFSVHRTKCGLQDFTLGHEIGHNYGMRHGDLSTDPPGQPQTPYLFPYSQGFIFIDPVDGQNRATVMACSCTGCFCNNTCVLGAGAVCNRIPYFSDPGRSYDNVVIGNATHNNALVGRSQVASYAGFFPASTNTPPTAAFTVSCAGRTCTFNGGGSTDNAGISSYTWDFGDHFTGSGQIVSHTYSSTYTTGTQIRAHLVVTDTGGQTNTVAGTATITPVYEGYHEVANCRSISGWAWDQNNPNGAINVTIFRDLTSVGTVPANAFRQDLFNAGKGNGNHGFGYTPTSFWKDGQWHAARVRFANTFSDLTWSPIQMICGVTCFTSQTPADNLSTGGQVYTVATQFGSSVGGYVTALRFYRAAGESGTNVGTLWSDGGSPLASVTFPSFPSSGWAEATLSSPVAISAGVRYRVSVNTNVQQSKTGCGIGSGITNQVLTAYQGFWIAGSAFPTTASCSNFFVDVKFDM